MQQASLCFLIRKNGNHKEVLLAMKKRGFGQGNWNGAGGKPDFEKGDKNIIETAVREAEEEIGIRVKKIEKVAILEFCFPYKGEWNQDVHVFIATQWEGEPRESEEMLPRWFKEQEIPYEKMWDDDRFWLPQVLEGLKLKANFVFKQGEIVAEQNIEIVENF